MKELKIGNHFWGIQRGKDESVVNGTIVSINEARNRNGEIIKYVELNNGLTPTVAVKVDDVYETGDEATNAYHAEIRNRIEEHKQTINNINDLVRFMFDNGIGYSKYYENYAIYQAVIEKTKELLGVELKRKLPCEHCLQIFPYKTYEKAVTDKVGGIEFTYLEKHGVCENCGHEMCVPEFYEENLERIRQAYRDAESKKKGDKQNEERK